MDNEKTVKEMGCSKNPGENAAEEQSEATAEDLEGNKEK